MTRANLPIAPNQFGRQEEQVFREHVRRGIEGSLGRDELPQYPGIPSLVLKGSNAAWSAPNGATPTIIPFDTLIYNSSKMTPTGTGQVTIGTAGLYQFWTSVKHTAVGANKTVDLSLCLFKNGTELSRSTSEHKLDLPWNLAGALMDMAISGDTYSMRLQHSETVAVVFDLTKSSYSVQRMSPDPAYVDRSRV